MSETLRSRKRDSRKRRALRLLLIENSENDATLLLRELRRGGYEPIHERVDTPEDMKAALKRADERGEPYEIVISDYSTPRLEAPEALTILKELGYDLPFIVASGKVGEELVVGIMRAGARDFIAKENMARLNPAVERELREAELRRERKRVEKAFRRSETRFRRLVEQTTDAIFVHDLEGRFVDVNQQACESLGYTRQELLGMSVSDIEIDYEPGFLEKLWEDISSGYPQTLNGRHRRKDGTTFPVEVRLGLYESEEESLLVASARDVSERRKAEERLKESEKRFRATFEQAAVGILQVGLEADWIRVNHRFCEIVGYTREELQEISVLDLISERDYEVDLERGARMLAGELQEYAEEKCIVGKDGKRIWINLNVSLVRDDSDEPNYFIAIVEDISKRKFAEEELRLRHRAITASPDGIVITDPNQPDNPIVYVNPSFELITGYTGQEAAGRNCRFLQGNDHDQPDIEELRQAINEERYCTVLLRNYRKDGSLFWNELSISPVWDDDGKLTHFIGVQEDVTDRKQAEDALRESEERFRALTTNASDIVLILESDGTIRYESPAIERILGYKPEERVGKKAFDLIHPDDVEHTMRALAGILRNPGVYPPIEYRTLAKDGTWHHFEAVGNNLLYDPAIQGIVVNSRDITERKKVEDALRQSELSLTEAQRIAHLGNWEYDVAEDLAYWSDELYRIFGLEPGQLSPTYRDFLRFVHPEDTKLVRDAVRKVWFAEEYADLEYRIVRPDGEVRVINTSYEAVREGPGPPIKLLGTIQDITERKRAQELQARLAAILEATPDFVATADAYTKRMLYVNQSGRRMVGISADKDISEIPLEDKYAGWARRVVLEEGIPTAIREGVWTGETAFLSPNGSEIPVLQVITSHKRPDGEVEYISTIARDITEIKQAEERFRATFSQAAVGLAHISFDDEWLRVNNKLCEIMGYTREELLGGTTFQNVTHPEDLHSDRDLLSSLMNDEIPSYSVEKRYLHKDGSIVWINLTVSIANDREGNAEYRIAVVEDITERKLDEAKLKRQSELIDLSHDAIMVLDSDGTITYWNRGAEEIYGWSREEAVGEAAAELLQTQFFCSREDVEATLLLAGRWEGELTHVRRDGRRVQIESRMAVVEGDGASTVMEINRDITERKRNEEELVRLASYPRLNPNPVIETSASGEITYLNPAAEAWFPDLEDRRESHPLLENLASVQKEIECSEGGPVSRGMRVEDNFYLQTVSYIPENGLLRLYITDVTERRRAEDGLRFLAEASVTLSSSLDYHVTLASVARLVVSNLADWCAIDVFEDGSLNRLAVASENPEKVAPAWQSQQRYVPDLEAQFGMSRVLGEGEPVLVSEVTESISREVARDEEHLRVLASLGFKSYMVLPLPARGRTLGAITLACGESRSAYGEADLKLAEDLAGRIAMAIDNARLYEEAQREISVRKEAEKALRASQERYQTFIAQSTEGILRLELEEPISTDEPLEKQIEHFYRYAYLAECNDALARMYGFSNAEEIVGARLDDVWPRSVPENVEFLRAGVRNDYKLAEAESQEFDRRGNRKYFLNNLTGIVENGCVVRAWGTRRNVTQRKHMQEALRQSEELYRTVVEQAAENIFLVDVETKRILECNEAFRSSLGYGEQEVQDMALYDLVLSDRESIDENIQLILDRGTHFIGERQYCCKDGSLLDVEVNVSVVELEDRQAMCVVAHDVTERKRAREALEEVRNAERSRIARDLHDDILQNMVYALQEAQIMQVVSEDGGSEELENIAYALKQSVEGLREAIFELRLTSTLGQSFIVSLQSLLEINRRMSRGQYSLELSVDREFPQHIPETAGREVIRIVQEALNNVRRHADARHVTVALGCEDELFSVEITDDGTGFDTRTYSGGVGQDSMRQRAEEIGGRLTVESILGAGSTVRLEVPRLGLISE